LTNEHVVNGCREVRIPPATSVAIVARDRASDLALLKSPPGANQAIVKFRQGRGIRPGDDIVVVGYPLRGLLASGMNVTTGTVSALAGPGDDRRFFQLTAPVQPGNSGGPVLDAAGNAVGVVMAKLNAIRIARATGDIPQNVNFAIGAGTVRAFLDANNVPYETAPSTNKLEPADVAAKARGYTVLIQCWK
jgi:S1-C subfamily serine protease